VGARQLEAGGACVVVLDAEFDGERLALELGRLLDTPGALDRMAASAAAIGHRDAAARVADLVEQHGRG
jgi:UDP-N-acetylglucosamine:LPS N-acetylglucosamine transferase